MNSPIGFWEQSYRNYMNLQPYMVKSQNTVATCRNKRYLWTMIASEFEFTLPKEDAGRMDIRLTTDGQFVFNVIGAQSEWALNFFRYFLFQWGSIGYLYTKKWGWVCLPYGYDKLSFYYQPHVLRFMHPAFESAKTGIVGINAGIIHIMDDYYGLDDIVSEYAARLAQVDKSVDINLMNSNVALTYPAPGRKEANEMKEAYSRATKGEPFIPINTELWKGNGIMPLITNVRGNYIASDLLEARRMIVNEFLTLIGIQNANTWKRERVTNEEVNQNNDETKTIRDVIFENLKEGFEKLKRLSGLDVGVELRYKESEVKENDNVMGNDEIRTKVV